MLNFIANFICRHPFISGVLLNYGAWYWLKKHPDDNPEPKQEEGLNYQKEDTGE